MTTTIGSIASQAGVSVDTIYKTFGSKAGILRAVYELGLEGEGAIPAEIRSDALQTTEPNARVVFAGLGTLSAEVAPRAAPIHLLIEEAAAGDPEMADLLAELEDLRLVRMTLVARNLDRMGHLRQGVTVEAAADIMWLYTAPSLYELLIVKRGWPISRYGIFVGESIGAALGPLE